MDLFKPDVGLLFWMLLSFVILFVILRKYAWPGILKGINERNKHIEDALISAQKAKEQMDEFQNQSQELIVQAKEEQIKILQEGKRIKDSIIGEAKEQARTEAEKIIDEAHKFIEKQKEEAMKEIDRKVANLSVDVAEIILKKKLEDAEEQKILARKLISKMSKTVEN
ncbi:MAG: F0F1 ATP synthase subunit B [Prevotellaceae bacterium]|jgi:F-type H+-transporting ATPase subunit b|nr:F0F1 ATP synthase subunit B [Prevotellaceae bacterium]